MRAMVLRQPGQPLHLKQRPDPSPAPREVRVPVEACAVCAGVIGWRSLRMAGDDTRSLGLYGLGAAAHLAVQCATHQGRRVPSGLGLK